VSRPTLRALTKLAFLGGHLGLLIVGACQPSEPRERPRPAARAPRDAHGQREVARDASPGDPFALADGARWTYRATITTTDPATGRDVTRPVTWTTEVTAVRAGDGVTAYELRGWPSDLASFGLQDDPAGTPPVTTRTLLRTATGLLWGTGGLTVDGARPWLPWPLTAGARACPEQGQRYCWQVTAAGTRTIVAFGTNPDEETYELEPGVGVVRYHYVHHGTRLEVEAVLRR
jgi:hypothetical protein